MVNHHRHMLEAVIAYRLGARTFGTAYNRLQPEVLCQPQLENVAVGIVRENRHVLAGIIRLNHQFYRHALVGIVAAGVTLGKSGAAEEQ